MGLSVRAFGWRVGAGAPWPAWLGISGMGRGGDGPDAICDMPRGETAVCVDRATILTEPRTRRECALAYRASVAIHLTDRVPGSVLLVVSCIVFGVDVALVNVFAPKVAQ
jgi:hypothetical protein